jgi:hypothetical protein
MSTGPSPTRPTFIQQVFQECCADGMLSFGVCYQLRQAATASELYRQLIPPQAYIEDKGHFSMKDMPKELRTRISVRTRCHVIRAYYFWRANSRNTPQLLPAKEKETKSTIEISIAGADARPRASRQRSFAFHSPPHAALSLGSSFVAPFAPFLPRHPPLSIIQPLKSTRRSEDEYSGVVRRCSSASFLSSSPALP